MGGADLPHFKFKALRWGFINELGAYALNGTPQDTGLQVGQQHDLMRSHKPNNHLLTGFTLIKVSSCAHGNARKRLGYSKDLGGAYTFLGGKDETHRGTCVDFLRGGLYKLIW